MLGLEQKDEMLKYGRWVRGEVNGWGVEVRIVDAQWGGSAFRALSIWILGCLMASSTKMGVSVDQ